MKTRIMVIGMTDILGGVETFIRNTYVNFDYKNFQVDFLHHNDKILFEEQFKQNNSNIYKCSKFLKNPIKAYIELKKIYKKNKYDVIHCNACSANMLVYFLPVLFMKKRPLIVMHSHNGSSHKKIRHYLFRLLLNQIVDIKYACSDVAGKWMFGNKSKYTVIPNGIITQNFKFNEKTRDELRNKYQISNEDIVLGSVGRLETVKNHEYIIQTLTKLEDNYKYVLIGNGSLKDDLIALTKELHLENRVILINNTDDIYNYYQMFDILVMPSLFEGLPMVCIEAQTSGLPLILSDNISKDAKLSKQVKFIDLENNDEWVKTIKEYGTNKTDRDKTNIEIENTFDSKKVAEKIEKDFIKSPKEKKKENLFWLFLLIPFFKPDIFVSVPKLNYLFSLYLLMSFCITACIYILTKKLSKFILLNILYFVIAYISTMSNHGNFVRLTQDFVLNVGIIMIVEILTTTGKTKNLFKLLTYIFYTLTLLNTLSFIVFPNGFVRTEIMKEPIFLLGIDNRFAFTYIPGICTIAIYDILKNKKITFLTYIYIAITYITLIYFWSAGALVAETIIIIFYILTIKFKKLCINPQFYAPVNILGFISLVFFRIQKLFKFIIVDILNKDLTLSDRTTLWDKSIALIKESPILGIGIQEVKLMTQKISAYHAHSHFLNILLQTGILGLISYITIIFYAMKKLTKYKSKLISKLIAFTIFTMYIMLIIDTFDITCNLIMLLAFASCIKNIREEKPKDEKKPKSWNSYSI